ncbi:cilia- and flagella-associated protein 300 [Bemisia tabaci]|uniref:cilia- and flagella-associated protein 300 n=1 Tax=Bemisia tabaci TaxID=7038 RepID=UPI003B28050D
MKGNLRIQHYCFNEPFQLYQKEDLVNSFFRDPDVINTLEVEPSIVLGRSCSRVEWSPVPCNVVSMNFFDKIFDPQNNITFDDKKKDVRTCEYSEVDGFVITDNLRMMLLDEEADLYQLYSKTDREQFLFRLFKHLCLGGLWCQYEDSLQPYLDVTKCLYKNLLSAEKEESSGQIMIRSVVLEAVVYGDEDKPILPKDPGKDNNFVYLIIDPVERAVTVLVHQVGCLII